MQVTAGLQRKELEGEPGARRSAREHPMGMMEKIPTEAERRSEGKAGQVWVLPFCAVALGRQSKGGGAYCFLALHDSSLPGYYTHC